MVEISDSTQQIQAPKPIDPMSDSDSDIGGGLFTEPPDFYKPEKPPTFVEFSLKTSQKINLRLVGHNPLWGHHLWNSGRVLAQYFQEHPNFVADKDVLELGAGAGLPGIVAGHLAARRVVITDYPDEDLVANLKWNVKENESLFTYPDTVMAEVCELPSSCICVAGKRKVRYDCGPSAESGVEVYQTKRRMKLKTLRST